MAVLNEFGDETKAGSGNYLLVARHFLVDVEIADYFREDLFDVL